MKVFLTLLIPFISANVWGSSKVSVYVSAHQDDWQLFMGTNAYDDIASNSKVVFIYITAGDYNEQVLSDKRETYYQAREQGAKNAVELAAGADKSNSTWSNDTVILKQHRIIHSTYENVSSYFLRLPDGGRDGEREISLRKFHQHLFGSNYSVDSLNDYRDWNDLGQTCSAILSKETEDGDEVVLNLFDTDEKYNPNDHSDHYESAMLFSNLLQDKRMRVRYFEGYVSGRKNHAVNLEAKDVVKESGLFAAYNQAMIDKGFPSVWNEDYVVFCTRNYFREAKAEVVDKGITSDRILLPFLLLASIVSIGIGFWQFKKS